MSQYAPSPRTGVYVGFGGGESNFQFLTQITGTGIAHDDPDTTPGEDSFDINAGATAARVGVPRAGRATYDLQLLDALPIMQDLRAAQRGNLKRSFREEQGVPDAVKSYTAADNVTLAIANTGIATLAGSASLNTGTNSAPQAGIRQGNIIEIDGKCYIVSDLLGDDKTFLVGELAAPVAKGANRWDRFRTVAQKPSSTRAAITQVSAQGVWTVHDYAVRRSFSGVVIQAAGGSTDGTVRSGQVVVQMDDFENYAFLIE